MIIRVNNKEYSFDGYVIPLNSVQRLAEKMYEQGRDDREKEVLAYLVKNGYIKYGFDEEYLAEQMKGAEK